MYIAPAGTAAVSNTTISSTAFNNLEADIGNEITNSLPTTGVKAMSANLPMGGNRITGMADPTSAQDAATKNYVDTATAPLSPTSVFIGGTSTGAANAQVLATTTPNSFTLTAGNRVVFIPGFTNTGAMTLAVNGLAATNILTPSAIGPTALSGGEVHAGQVVEAIYDGTQFVLVINPNMFLGAPTALASAATTDLGTIPSHFVNITGTTAITSFGSSASVVFPVYRLIFASSLTLTYSPPNMILPGGNNIYTGPGDAATVVYFGSGNWQLIDYQVNLFSPGIVPAWGAYKNLKVQVASDTTVTVTADEMILEDTSTRTYRARFVSQTNTITTSGAGGLDTGTATASNFYSVWIIYNQTTNTVSSLVSLSATAPTMPAGYTFKMRVGWVRYDSQPKLWRTLQYGRVAQIVIGTNPLVTPVVASGPNGTLSASSPTLASISLAAFVPPTACKARLYCYNSYKNGGIGEMMLAPNTSFGGTNNGPNGSNGQIYPLMLNNTGGTDSGGFSMGGSYELVLEALSFGVAMGGAGAGIGIGGWEDNL